MKREFAAAPGSARMTPQELRSRGDAMVRVECPRLLARDSAATGAAAITITVDREGSVTRAVVERGTGDDRMDELLGTLAASLDFDAPRGMAGPTMDARVVMGYSCSARASAITFRVMPPEGAESAPLTPPVHDE
ncbi:MAG TPA: TonB family protein [Gemmatimonadaceae bacterium]|nr:TonB family protein [Gemmatimonadaceae bacterium]